MEKVASEENLKKKPNQALAFRAPKAAVMSWALWPLSRPKRSLGVQWGLAEKMPCTHQTCFAFLCLLSGSSGNGRMVWGD